MVVHIYLFPDTEGQEVYTVMVPLRSTLDGDAITCCIKRPIDAWNHSISGPIIDLPIGC